MPTSTQSISPFTAESYTLAPCRWASIPLTDKRFTPMVRNEMIAQAAYFRAERRGFKAGHELDDWLAAEHQVNSECGQIEPDLPVDLPNDYRPLPLPFYGVAL